MRTDHVFRQITHRDIAKRCGFGDPTCCPAIHIEGQWVPVRVISITPLINVHRSVGKKSHVHTDLSLCDTRTRFLNISFAPLVIATRDMPHALKFLYPAIISGKKDLTSIRPNPLENKLWSPIGDNSMGKPHCCFVRPTPAVFLE